MTTSSLHQEVKQLIVDALELDDLDPSTISDTEPLIGAGLHLDSIDALELATSIARTFHIKVNPDQDTRNAFRSVNHLVAFIVAQRKAAADGSP